MENLPAKKARRKNRPKVIIALEKTSKALKKLTRSHREATKSIKQFAQVLDQTALLIQKNN